MYSKQEASRMRQEFWLIFGQYMLPVQSADGSKVNWVNYKTGIKDVLFRMSADNQQARISIDMVHSDEGVRQLFYQQFLQLKEIFHNILQEEWNWELQANDDSGKAISRISIKMEEVSVFRKDDWPRIISFLKPRIILLDEFWSSVAHVFDGLK
jgi:hypothetical protein